MRLIGHELLIVALAAAVGAQDLSRRSVSGQCPAGSSGTLFVRNESCYEFNGVAEDWVQARTNCHERGGRLVSITDAGLQVWLSSTSARLWPTRNGVWIGLNDRSKSGVFLWDDYGTNAEHQMSYSNWASGYPSNGVLSGDCVLMRGDNDWQWFEQRCLSYLYIYNYICEYRVADTLHVNATLPDISTPDTMSVGSLTPEAGQRFTSGYSLAVVSSARNDAAHESGIITSNSDVVLPLSVSAAVSVLVAALIAVAIVLRQRQQCRYRKPEGSVVSQTHGDDGKGFRAVEPMFEKSPQHAMKQAFNTCEHFETSPTYAEPSMQDSETAINEEAAVPYHLYASIDSATLLQQPGTSVRKVSPADQKDGSLLSDLSE